MAELDDPAEAPSSAIPGKAAAAEISGDVTAKHAKRLVATTIDGGALVAGVLGSLGVKYLFAVNGGHTWPILARLREHGIKLIHMRHEQSCAYAADGWARTSGTPGVCNVTAGCGLTNAVTGLCAAGLAGSAVICIAGQHPTTEDALGSFQEAYGSDICRSFSKSTKRLLDWSTIEVDLRQAFREATSAPQGVALVEIPINILCQRGPAADQRRGAKVYAAGELRSGGDPESIARAVEIVRGAERPLIAAGDGVFWSGASAELRAFAELTGIPVYGRRTGQGVLAEDHPLAVRGAWKKSFTGRADAVLAIGFRFWSGEGFGEPPTWSKTARYIQSDSVPTRIGLHVPRRPGARPLAISSPTASRRGSACTSPPRSRSSAMPASSCASSRRQHRGRIGPAPHEPDGLLRSPPCEATSRQRSPRPSVSTTTTCQSIPHALRASSPR
jgi:thiamine pyrophosphate-dependent acetolactate synthase large subunit-like protein